MKNSIIGLIVLLGMFYSCKNKTNYEVHKKDEKVEIFLNIIRNTDSAKILKDGIVFFTEKDEIVDSVTNFSEVNGIGLVKKLDFEIDGHINERLSNFGKFIYEKGECGKCHNIDKNSVDNTKEGPGLLDLVSRRKPEWIVNYLNMTDSMIKSNIIASSLKDERGIKMKNFGLSLEEARALLEYFKSFEIKN